MKIFSEKMRGAIWAGILAAVFGVSSVGAQQTSAQKPDKKRIYLMTDKKQVNVGKKFPQVSAKTLEDKPAVIPDDARGKVTLVTVAFLRESQSQLDSWLTPFYEKFGNRDGFMFYEVPMISGGYKFMRFVIDGGMRAGLPDFKHKHVVTMYGDVESYTKTLQLDPQKGHAFLLDKEGVIRWQGQGFATPESLKEMFALAEALAK